MSPVDSALKKLAIECEQWIRFERGITAGPDAKAASRQNALSTPSKIESAAPSTIGPYTDQNDLTASSDETSLRTGVDVAVSNKWTVKKVWRRLSNFW